MHHVSFKLIRFSLNDCTTSPGRRQYHLLIFATSQNFQSPIGGKISRSPPPNNETLGLLTLIMVTFSEKQIKFENSLSLTASSES